MAKDFSDDIGDVAQPKPADFANNNINIAANQNIEDPDKLGKAFDISARTGRSIDEIRHASEMRQLQAQRESVESSIRNNAQMAEWFAKSPDNALLSYDDIDKMTELQVGTARAKARHVDEQEITLGERLLAGAASPAMGIRGGIGSLSSSIYGTVQAAAELVNKFPVAAAIANPLLFANVKFGDAVTGPDGLAGFAAENALIGREMNLTFIANEAGGGVQDFVNAQKTLDRFHKAKPSVDLGIPFTDISFNLGIDDIFGAGVSLAPTLVAGLATGGLSTAAQITAMSGVAGMQSFGAEFSSSRAENQDFGEAFGDAALAGTITAVLTRAFGATGTEGAFLRINKLLRNSTDPRTVLRSELIKTVGKDTYLEFFEEGLDEGLQAWLVEGADFTDIANAFLKAGTLGGILGGGNSLAANLGNTRIQAVDRAKAFREENIELANHVDATKTGQRSQEQTAKFMQDAGGMRQEAYIDGDAALDIIQDDPAAAQQFEDMGVTAEAINNAVETGSLIPLDRARVVTNTNGAVREAIINQVRETDNSPTYEEARNIDLAMETELIKGEEAIAREARLALTQDINRLTKEIVGVKKVTRDLAMAELEPLIRGSFAMHQRFPDAFTRPGSLLEKIRFQGGEFVVPRETSDQIQELKAAEAKTAEPSAFDGLPDKPAGILFNARQEMSDSDLEAELEYLNDLADRGKLTIERLRDTELWKANWNSISVSMSIPALSAAIKNDPKAAVAELLGAFRSRQQGGRTLEQGQLEQGAAPRTERRGIEPGIVEALEALGVQIDGPTIKAFRDKGDASTSLTKRGDLDKAIDLPLEQITEVGEDGILKTRFTSPVDQEVATTKTFSGVTLGFNANDQPLASPGAIDTAERTGIDDKEAAEIQKLKEQEESNKKLEASKVVLDGQAYRLEEKEERKAWAKLIPTPESIPEEHATYFLVEEADEVVDISRITSEVREESAINAAKFMQASGDGKLRKRLPIQVKRLPNGDFEAVDGNSTVQAAKNYGWKQIPILIAVESEVGKPAEVGTMSKAKGKLAEQVLLETQTDEDFDKSAESWTAAFDAIYAKAPGLQDDLNAFVEQVAEETGASTKGKEVAIKIRATAEDKVLRKEYKNPGQLTDIVRNGFLVDSPAQADAVVKAMSKRFPLVDEGWNTTPAAYFDRKLLVRMDDGTIAEIQIWQPDLFVAKETDGGGHKFYDIQRMAAKGSYEFVLNTLAMQELYTSVALAIDPIWKSVVDFSKLIIPGGGTETLAANIEAARERFDLDADTMKILGDQLSPVPIAGSGPNVDLNSSNVNRLPESNTSPADTSTQSPPGSSIDVASTSPTTAGLPSQLKNDNAISTPSAPIIDEGATESSAIVPDRAPDGIDGVSMNGPEELGNTFESRQEYYQAAYAGSRATKINKFLLEFIGTGESASILYRGLGQSLSEGWGLYFSGSKDIADVYAAFSSADNFIQVDGVPIERMGGSDADFLRAFEEGRIGYEEWLANHLHLHEGSNFEIDPFTGDDIDVSVKTTQELRTFLDKHKESFSAEAKRHPTERNVKIAELLGRDFDTNRLTLQRGSTTAADVPESSELLQHDKLMSEQPESVANAIQGMNLDFEITDEMNGQEFYNKLARSLRSKNFEKIEQEIEDLKAQERPVGHQQGTLFTQSHKDIEEANNKLGVQARKKRDQLGKILDKSRKSASLSLDRAGIPGAEYEGGSAVDEIDVEARNFVIWDEAAIKVIDPETGPTAELFQDQAGGPRGSLQITNEGYVISLFPDADLSTILHETGHIFMEEMLSILSSDNANAGIIADWDKTANWQSENITEHKTYLRKELSKQGLSDTRRNKLTKALEFFDTASQAEVKSAALQFGHNLPDAQAAGVAESFHELWARGFEGYLLQGKAPSLELEKPFSRFRRWLSRIYKSVLQLNVNVTEEITDVFNRMLATDVEIQALTAVNELTARSKEEMERIPGVGPSKRTKFNDKLKELREAAANNLYKERVQRANVLRKQLQPEVTEEVMSRRVYLAWTEIVEKDGLNHSRVLTSHGQDTVNALRAKGLIAKTKKGEIAKSINAGALPDEVARNAGYDDSEEMIVELLDARAPTREIKLTIDNAIVNSEIKSPSMDAVINSPEFDEAVEMMNQYLSDAVRGTRSQISRAALKRKAQDDMAEMVMRDAVRSDRFEGSVQRALKAERRAVAGDQFADALAFNEEARVQSAMAKNARVIRDRRDKTILAARKLPRMDKSSIEYAYFYHVNKLAARFGLIPDNDLLPPPSTDLTLSELMVTTAVDDEMNAMPDYGAWLMQGDASPRLGQLDQQASRSVPVTRNPPKRYHMLKVWEFEELQRMMDFLVKKGRLLKNDTINHGKEKLQEVIDESVDEMSKVNDRVRKRADGTPIIDRNNFISRYGQKIIDGLWAPLKTVAPILRTLDGFNGPRFKDFSISKPLARSIQIPLEIANKAKEVLNRDTMEAMAPYLKILKRAIDRLGKNVKTDVPITQSMKDADYSKWTGQMVLGVALNMGNTYNAQAMAQGMGWLVEKEQADGSLKVVPDIRNGNRLMELFTDEELSAIQGIWDTLNTLWAPSLSVHEQLYAFPPGKVEADPVTIVREDGSSITLNGGYYPLRGDPKDKGASTARLDDVAALKEIFGGSFAPPAAKRNHLIARNGFGNKLVMLDPSRVINDHLDMTINLITHGVWLRDTRRIFNNQQWSKAARLKIGDANYKQLNGWLRAIVGRERQDLNWFDNTVQAAKGATSIFYLAFKLKGIVTTADAIPRLMGDIGFWNYMRGVGSLINGDGWKRWQFMLNESSHMRDRLKGGWEREAKDLVKGSLDLNTYSGFATAKKKGVEYALATYATPSLMYEWPAWSFTYEKTLQESGDHDIAVATADLAIKSSEPSAAVSDRSQISRDRKSVATMGTMFSSWAHTGLNSNRFAARALLNGEMSPAEYVSYAFFTNLMPAAMFAAIGTVMGIAFGDLGDEDEEEIIKSLGEDFARNVITDQLRGIPFAADLADPLLKEVFEEDPSIKRALARGTSSNRLPVVVATNIAVKGIEGMYDVFASDDEEEQRKALWDIAHMVSYYSGIPVSKAFEQFSIAYDSLDRD